jgi:hypothetical protein
MTCRAGKPACPDPAHAAASAPSCFFHYKSAIAVAAQRFISPNPRARIETAEFGCIALDRVLDTHLFDFDAESRAAPVSSRAALGSGATGTARCRPVQRLLTGADMDEDALRGRLAQCLMTNEELAEGPEDWLSLEDPIMAAWKIQDETA